MRKIRIFFIAPESALCEDICDLLALEDYDVFYAPDCEGMDIVYDVFMPDIVMIYNLTLVQQKEIIDFFSISLNHPLLLLVRKWLYLANRHFYRNIAPRTRLISAPFRIDEMLEEIELLIADVKADIEWLSTSIADNLGD